ncbi:MAG: phage integrase SAM-like domain-containing protein [Planctomycetaceae bacterium]|nr:phage integrase SAM-like domain-containing protein [Planctomycetaceae bacterium]
MASKSIAKNGSVTVYVYVNGSRKKLRIGRVSKRQVESICVWLGRLESSRSTNEPVDKQTADWLNGIDDQLHQKISNVGLVLPRSSANLMDYVDGYISERSEVKQSTATVWRRTRNHLQKFFGPERQMRDVTLGDAKDFRRYLLSEKTGKRALSEDTTRRTCGIAKQFFEDAKDRGMLDRNPFKHRDIPTATGAGDKSREFFVSRELAERVMFALPDAQWRLMFALARFGGLRCPSEVLSLRWCDIDWENDRMIVSSPKREHHEGGELEVVPLFPEIRPYLDECYDLAEDGAEFVISRYRKFDSNYGTLLTKHIRQAKLKPWPKPFQNLPSTQETELAEEFPMHVVCSWIGNSQLVAAKHYQQVTDDHFKAAQKVGQQTSTRGCNG